MERVQSAVKKEISWRGEDSVGYIWWAIIIEGMNSFLYRECGATVMLWIAHIRLRASCAIWSDTAYDEWLF